MLNELRKAIASDELYPLYQPQVTADGRRIDSVEALVRWRHPVKGNLPPAAFIGAAESLGLMNDLGRWMLHRACKDALRWPSLTVSVNVSPSQFSDPDFVHVVCAAAAEAGVSPSRIELELTENVLIGDPDLGRSIISDLRKEGFRFALDDFGTGYSSLSYLRQLPLDKLKIDKSFIDDCGLSQGAAIVHAIAALARALGLKVTAEGVETREQQAFLKPAGCHYLQGYFFSRPVPPESITDMLAAQDAKAPLVRSA